MVWRCNGEIQIVGCQPASGQPVRQRHANDLSQVRAALRFQPVIEFTGDGDHPSRLGEEPGADLDGARAGHEELQGIVEPHDAAESDDRDSDDLSDLIRHPHRDRLDRWAGQPTGPVGKDGPAATDVDGHTDERVDQADRVGATFLGRQRDPGNIGGAWTEFDDNGQRRGGTNGGGDIPAHRWVPAKAEATRVDVRAGDVDLQGGDSGDIVKLPGHLGEIGDRFRRDVDDRREAPCFPDRRILPDERTYPWVLETDGVEHPARCLGDPWHRVARTRLRSDPLGDERAELADVDRPLILLPVPKTPGRGDHRIGKPEFPRVCGCEIDRQVSHTGRSFRVRTRSSPGNLLDREDRPGDA